MDADLRYLQQALAAAEAVAGRARPNPTIGCVLVQQDRVIGVGATQKAGGAHAEVVALNAARQTAPDQLRGATAYVTLEPCCHQGRTPPCTQALIVAGIARVVVLMLDPNPLVSGQGVHALRQAGIQVDLCPDMPLVQAALALNKGFFWRMMSGRPWVHSKIAMSLDAKMALSDGRSQWITGEDARAHAHQWRAAACAVMTGVGTVLADDPQLTVCFGAPKTSETSVSVTPAIQPDRIVLDTHLRTLPQARLFQPSSSGTFNGFKPGEGEASRVILVCSEKAAQSMSAAALRAVGAEILPMPLNAQGRLHLPQLLHTLGETYAYNRIHVEAGSTLNSALYAEELLDELMIYQAPKVLGAEACAAFIPPQVSALDEVQPWQWLSSESVGADLFLHALHRLHWQSMISSRTLGFGTR